MIRFILFDDPQIRQQLLPFTYTRPVSLIRCGIMTIAEKWQEYLKQTVSYLTVDYLQPKFPPVSGPDNWYINGSLLPDEELVNTIMKIPLETALLDENGQLIAFHSKKTLTDPNKLPDGSPHYTYTGQLSQINHVWDIFLLNPQQIRDDFEKLTLRRKSFPLTDPHTICYNSADIFIEEGAQIKAAVLNAENGPIYIGKNAQISEGALIQGPFALNEGAVVAQGAKIRPGTSVGPYCKVGGEINNAVFFGFSNKGHDGYLGNAVLGEWCNLGANTNNSNLKNDITPVSIYNYTSQKLESTGLTFCGLFMGDYSKAGISTMFNTGTTVGVGVNVFGAGFQAKHVPSFTWGGAAEGYEPYRIEKALEVIRQTQLQKKVEFTETDETILRHIHLLSHAVSNS